MNVKENLEKKLVNSCERLASINDKLPNASPMLNNTDVNTCSQLLDMPSNQPCIDKFEKQLFGSSRTNNNEEYNKIMNDFDERYKDLFKNVNELNSDIVDSQEDNTFKDNTQIFSERFRNDVTVGLKLLNDLATTSEHLMFKISNDYSDVETDQYKNLVNSYYKVSENYKKIDNNSDKLQTSHLELENFKNINRDKKSYNNNLIIVLVVFSIMTAILYFIFIRF